MSIERLFILSHHVCSVVEDLPRDHENAELLVQLISLDDAINRELARRPSLRM